MHHPSAASPSTPASDARSDRMLAAAAYLGSLVGLWLLAPIAVYALRRRYSRFAAHHAAQAAILHLLLGLLLTVTVVLSTLLASTLLVVGTGPLGADLLIALAWSSWLVPSAIHLGLTAVAVLRACRGRVDTTSRLGRWAAWLLAQDPGLAPPVEQGPADPPPNR